MHQQASLRGQLPQLLRLPQLRELQLLVPQVLRLGILRVLPGQLAATVSSLAASSASRVASAAAAAAVAAAVIAAASVPTLCAPPGRLESTARHHNQAFHLHTLLRL